MVENRKTKRTSNNPNQNRNSNNNKSINNNTDIFEKAVLSSKENETYGE